jgi:hypothetical protein
MNFASGTLNAFQGVAPPTTIEHLEDAIQVIFFFLGGGGQRPLVFSSSLVFHFSNYSYLVQHPVTGMTGISMHMQWPLTSLSHDSFLKENDRFFSLRNKLHATNLITLQEL